MRISEKGLSLIKEFEGCQLNAYRCPSNVWTIGYGHTENVQENQSITQEEAESLLINDMVKYENYVNTCSNLTFVTNQNQFDALVSFTYNCGQGSLATLVQNRDANTVADKLLLYINGSNGVLQGLVRRREAERVLFLDGNYVEVTPTEQVVEQYSTPQSDTWVADLQNECNNQGYSSQAVDNIAGKITLASVPTLKKGSKGEITKLLQKRLNSLGFDCGKADGSFGNLTFNAVISMQNYYEIDSEGICGKQSWSKLLGL